MSPQRRASLNLADTLLANAATHTAMVAATARAFGKNWPWIAGMCRVLLQQTHDDLHGWSRDELADLIDAQPAYRRAWKTPETRPRVVHWALQPALLPPRPDWIPQHLPRWSTPGQLADWLGLTPEALQTLTRQWRQSSHDPARAGHYSYRWMEKRRGGFRLIEMPKSRLRDAQRRLLQGFLQHIPAHPAAHGYVARRSCLSHAAMHSNQPVVVTMDLRDFFSSVAASRVHALFRALGCPVAVARLLTGLCTHRTPWSVLNQPENRARIPFAQRQWLAAPHLPQGAPTSPALANLCAFRLDLRLAALASALDANYSRYADDLVFSGSRERLSGTPGFPARVGAIALEEGFVLHPHKTRFMPAGGRQSVTGLIVNRFPNVRRTDYDALKAILHNCARHGVHAQNLNGVADFRAHLLGRIAWVAASHPVRGSRLKQGFDQIDWSE